MKKYYRIIVASLFFGHLVLPAFAVTNTVTLKSKASTFFQKPKEISKDTSIPQIEFISPKDGDTIKPGTIVPVELKITDNDPNSSTVYVNGQQISGFYNPGERTS